MALTTSSVPKCLEKKMLLLGFELVDLFTLSLLLCALNFCCGNSPFKLFITFGLTAISAVALRAVKRGKAENYLGHLIRYHVSSGVLRAFPPASTQNAFFNLRRKGKFNL